MHTDIHTHLILSTTDQVTCKGDNNHAKFIFMKMITCWYLCVTKVTSTMRDNLPYQKENDRWGARHLYHTDMCPHITRVSGYIWPFLFAYFLLTIYYHCQITCLGLLLNLCLFLIFDIFVDIEVRESYV